MNAEYGVIYFRGEVPSEDVMEELAKRARKVDGVRARGEPDAPPERGGADAER